MQAAYEISSSDDNSDDTIITNENTTLQWSTEIKMLQEKYLKSTTDEKKNIDTNLLYDSSSAPQEIEEINNIYSDNEVCVEMIQNKKNLQKRKLKDEERMKKKEIMEQTKALKKNRAENARLLKAENCLKLVCVNIDIDIVNKYGENIFNQLKSNSVLFQVKSAAVKNSISWTINEEILKEVDTNFKLPCKEEVIVMDCTEFVKCVHTKSLANHMKNLSSNLREKQTILTIYGMEKYYRYHKNKKTQILANEMTQKTVRKIKDQDLFNNLPYVSRRDVEYILSEIQLLYSVLHRFVDTEEELDSFIFHLTKSIASIPNRLNKQAKFDQAKYFMSEDNRDTVKVSKNGNGLSSLWKQVICTFPLASLETAEAIMSIYPTYISLMQDYQKHDQDNGEMLLANIPIRRTAGPFGSTRCIGPELSKKFYKYFTSTNGEAIL